jgi:hypothetical protein
VSRDVSNHEFCGVWFLVKMAMAKRRTDQEKR